MIKRDGIQDYQDADDLRSETIVPQNFDKVYVAGVGLFDWDPMSSLADNGLTVIAQSSQPAGRWVIVSGGTPAILDIKQGLQNADHGGWVLLNGRAIASLTSTQQAVANTVFTGNLPDATGAYLAQGGTLGAVSGSNTKTIAQANIPNYALPTATTSSNSHSHTGTTSTDSHNHTYNHAISYVRSGTSGGSIPNDNANTTTTTDSHNHTFTTSTNAHTHTVSVNSGGSGTAFDITPKTLSVNTFVYLGL